MTESTLRRCGSLAQDQYAGHYESDRSDLQRKPAQPLRGSPHLLGLPSAAQIHLGHLFAEAQAIALATAHRQSLPTCPSVQSHSLSRPKPFRHQGRTFCITKTRCNFDWPSPKRLSGDNQNMPLYPETDHQHSGREASTFVFPISCSPTATSTKPQFRL